MAKVKPKVDTKLAGFDELFAQLTNVRSVIMEAKAAVDAVDLQVCRAMNRLASAKKDHVEGAWGEKKAQS